MALLGQMLVDEGVITPKQLDEAIQAQVIFGGRLGTNLLELGYLDERTLTKYLAKKHGVPTVDWKLLNRIKPQVLKLFSKKLAKSAEAFPLKVEGREIFVVMADPGNLTAVQDIGFATGKRVKPLVLPEVRIYDLLTRFYNIGRELRYINLAMMYQIKEEEAQHKPAAQPAGPPPGMNEQEWREREEIRKSIDFSQSEDLLGEDQFHQMTDQQFSHMPGASVPAPEPEPPSPPQAPPPKAAPPTPEPPRPSPPAPAPEKAPAPEAPAPPRVCEPAPAPKPAPAKPGVQPYREVAQSLYSLLMKRGVCEYMAKETLQEFLKLFVRNQLKNYVLSMNYLANWLIIESNAPVEWLEQVLDEFKGVAESFGVLALMPGESLPESPAPPKAAVVEEAEPAMAVEEISSDELEPVEEALPPAPAPAQEEAATPPEEPAPPAAEAEPEAPPPPPAAAAPEARRSAEDFLDELESMEAEKAAPGESSLFELRAEDLAAPGELFEAPDEEFEDEEEEEEEEEYAQLTMQEAQSKLLSEVTDRRDISRIVLGFAKGFFKRSFLFTVRGQTLFGWDGDGPGIRSDMVESIMLSLADPSVFQLVNMTMSFFLGPMPPGPVNDRYLKLLGGEKPNNVFIIPVVVNEKVVYILYGDNGDGEFVPVNAPELQILAYQIPRALEMLIKRKKESMPAT